MFFGLCYYSEDTSTVFIDIGAGVHLEFTRSEALEWLQTKLTQLTTQLEVAAKKEADLRSFITVVSNNIAQLKESVSS